VLDLPPPSLERKETAKMPLEMKAPELTIKKEAQEMIKR